MSNIKLVLRDTKTEEGPAGARVSAGQPRLVLRDTGNKAGKTDDPGKLVLRQTKDESQAVPAAGDSLGLKSDFVAQTLSATQKKIDTGLAGLTKPKVSAQSYQTVTTPKSPDSVLGPKAEQETAEFWANKMGERVDELPRREDLPAVTHKIDNRSWEERRYEHDSGKMQYDAWSAAFDDVLTKYGATPENIGEKLAQAHGAVLGKDGKYYFNDQTSYNAYTAEINALISLSQNAQSAKKLYASGLKAVTEYDSKRAEKQAAADWEQAERDYLASQFDAKNVGILGPDTDSNEMRDRERQYADAKFRLESARHGADSQRDFFRNFDIATAVSGLSEEERNYYLNYDVEAGTKRLETATHMMEQADATRRRETDGFGFGISDPEQSEAVRDADMEYNAWVRMTDQYEQDVRLATVVQGNAKYSVLRENPDFKKESGYKPGVQDEKYQYINTKGREREGGEVVWNFDDDHIYSYMTDVDVSIYNYLYHTQGAEAADDFLAYIGEALKVEKFDLIQRAARNFGDDHEVIGSIASVPVNIIGGVVATGESLGRGLFGYEQDPYSGAQAIGALGGSIREGASKDMSGFGKFLYDTTMSGLDSLAVSWLPGGSGAALLASTAYAGTARDIALRGGSDRQIVLGGLAAATFEGLFERWSIGNFKSMKEVPVKSVKDILGNLLKSSGVNAAEETLTELANIVWDTATMGELSQWEMDIKQYMADGLSRGEAEQKVFGDMALRVLESGASGGLMGFGFGTVGSAQSAWQNGNSRTKNAASGMETAGNILRQAEEKMTKPENISRTVADGQPASVSEGRTGTDIISPDVAQRGTEGVSAPISEVQMSMIENTFRAAKNVLGEHGTAVFTKQFDPTGDPAQQLETFVRAYHDGQKETRRNDPGTLSREQYDAAFETGRADAKAAQTGGTTVQVAENAGVDWKDDYVKSMNQEVAKRIDQLGKDLGVRVRFVDAIRPVKGKNGIVGTADGQYEGNEILVEKNNHNPELFIAGHEFAHRMQDLAPETYNSFVQAVLADKAYFARGGTGTVEGAITAKIAQYKLKGETLTREAAINELVADYAGHLLTNETYLDSFMESHKENRTMLEKLRDLFHEFSLTIKGALGNKAAIAERKLTQMLESSKQSAQEIREGKAQKKTASDGGGVKYTLKPTEQIETQLGRIRKMTVDFEMDSISIGTIPNIYTKLFDISELDMTVNMRHAYNSMVTVKQAKKDGMFRLGFKDDYHGMGVTGYAKAIRSVEKPLAIMDADKSGQRKNLRIAMILRADEMSEPLFGVIELYSKVSVEGNTPQHTHALLTIYDKQSAPEYVKTAIEKNRMLYIDREQNLRGTPADQSRNSIANSALEKNLSRFNQKVKAFKEENKINDEALLERRVETGIYSLKTDTDLDDEINAIYRRGHEEGLTEEEMRDEVDLLVEQRLQEARDRYGVIPAGENPAREVQVPKRTAGASIELDNSKLERAAERYKKALDKVRANRDAKLKKLKAEHRAKEAVGRERRKARELRQKIERHASELSRKLLRPNDKKHIPQALQGPVARLLEAVNLESQYTIDPENGKHQKTPEGLPNKRTKAFAELKAAYAEIKGELVIDPDLLGEDGTAGLLDEVLAMADTPIAAMNSEQLTTMWKAIRAVEASITSTNKLFKASRFKTVGELAQVLQEDNKGKSAKAEYNYIGGLQKLTGLDMMTPETFLHRLGSAGDTIFRMMRNAQDEHIRIMKETADFSRKALAGINVRKLEKELHTVTLGGEEVTLSTAQLMELYALMRREQAQNHIYKGGILPDAVSGKGLKKNVRTEAVQGISEQEVLDALELLTDEQMELAEKLQDYASNTLSGHGNKASMAVYNYEKFNEEHYWPIRSNRRETHSDVQKDTQVTTVANRGFTKAVKPNANTSVCVGSIFDTFASHASEMATYAAWLEVTEDINRIRNFVFRDKDGNRTGSVKGIIDRVHGSKGSDYLSKLLGDIANGVKSTHGQTEYMGRIVGNYKAAAVGANLRVVIQQPTAILRAMDMIDPKYLVMGMKPGDGWKKALKYAPIAQWKDWGYFDINTGRQMKDVLFDSASGWEKARQGAMWLAGKMDSLAWGQLWNACETEVREQQGKPAGPTWEELTAKDPIKVVELAENTEGLSYAELKARALKRAEDKGWFEQPHRNRDSGMGVFVSEDTFTHAFSNLTARFGEDTILAMERLPEIIEEAVLTHAEGPKNPFKSEIQVYTLFAAVRGKNGVEPVKLKVKEYNSDTIGTMPEAVRTWFAQNKKQPTYHRLYDAKVLEVVSIEREVDASASVNVPEGTQAKGTSTSRYSLTGAGAGVKGAKRETDASASGYDHEGPQAKGTPVSEISVADLLDLVNGDARKYIPEPEAGADTEAFYRAVAERFTQIIDHTQVVDGILQRSQIMRDPGAWAKMATSFMGEPTKQYNMMMYAVYDAKNGSKEQRSAGRKRLARTVFALAAAGLVNAAAQSIMDAVRDDDDEKEYWEKWMEAFGKNAANMANPAQYIPYVKDVVSVVQGYDVSRMDMESIEKTFQAAKNFVKALGGEGKYSVPGASANLFAEGARLLGIPVANFKRDVMSFAKLWAAETDSYLMQYHIQKGALNLNYYDNSGDFMDILYNAYANDRKAYEIIYADMVKSGYDADKIKSGMETRMKKAQGVESVADLKERYLAPEQSKQYEQGRKKLAGSALWKKATVQQRKAAEDDLYEMIAGTDDGERLKEKVGGGAVYGLSESEYLLYRLALSMADEPNDSGGMGTYTNAEVERAIDMVSGLSDAERSYLWLAQGKHPTSNPYD